MPVMAAHWYTKSRLQQKFISREGWQAFPGSFSKGALWMTVKRMVFGVFLAFWALIAGLWLLLQTWRGLDAFMIFLGGILVAYALTFFLLFFLHWRHAK